MCSDASQVKTIIKFGSRHDPWTVSNGIGRPRLSIADRDYKQVPKLDGKPV